MMLDNGLVENLINPKSKVKWVDDIMQYACCEESLAAFRVRRDLKETPNDSSVLLAVTEQPEIPSNDNLFTLQIMSAEDQIRNGANPYGVRLAENINLALPKARCIYGSGNIYLYLPDSEGYKTSSIGWLKSLLETLPPIDAPLERLQVIIYVNEAIERVTIINPSEFDAKALDKPKIDGLSSSRDAVQGSNTPMPLDHPWYSDKDYFKKNGT